MFAILIALAVFAATILFGSVFLKWIDETKYRKVNRVNNVMRSRVFHRIAYGR